MAQNERFGRDARHRRAGSRLGRLAVAAAALAALGGGRAAAQTTLEVPGVSGDQLVYFYDARTGRVPFLNIANPGSTPVVVELAFYPQTLGARLGTAVFTLAAGGNLVVDPTDPSFAGGAANGNAGLAIATPIASEADATPVVPPEPLTGGYTLANTTLAAAFGENPYGRLAVTSNGNRASAGTTVDGDTVRYQRFTPSILMVPTYFNPGTLAPPADDGNRIILAAFSDQYGTPFEVGPVADTPPALFCDAEGFAVGNGSPTVNGVLLTNLQEIAGAATLDASGKLFLEVSPGSGNVFGIFFQSLGTFAAGQRMPAVDNVPDCPAPPMGTPPGPTPGGSATQCPAGGTVNATITVNFDDGGGAINIPGVTARLSYSPPLALPGSLSEQSVADRVTNLTGVTNGLFQVSDNDNNSDGTDDEVQVGLVVIGSRIPPGQFARVQFDCTPGAVQAPTCVPDVLDEVGNPFDATCTVALTN